MTPPLRVALDGHSLGGRAGGNESYVRGLVEGLESLPDVGDARFDVYVDKSADGTPSWPDTDRAAPGRIRYRPLRSRSSWSRLLMELPRVFREDTPDVAHFQYVSPPACPCPVVLSVHDASFCTAPARLGWATAVRLRLTSLWSLAAARWILVPSHYTATRLTEHRPGLEDKIRVIPLAPSSRFTPTGREDDGAVRRALGLPERYLLYVGRRHRRKNLCTLVDAYAEAVVGTPDLPALCLAGPDSSSDAQLVRRRDRWRLGDRLQLLGYVPEGALPAVYRGAEMFLFPGIEEGFGLPMAEAMACGRPVIAADAGALPEVGGGTVNLVPSTDPHPWAEAICRLAGDASRRRQMGRLGQERAKIWSWTETARQTLAVYRDTKSGQERGSR